MKVLIVTKRKAAWSTLLMLQVTSLRTSLLQLTILSRSARLKFYIGSSHARRRHCTETLGQLIPHHLWKCFVHTLCHHISIQYVPYVWITWQLAWSFQICPSTAKELFSNLQRAAVLTNVIKSTFYGYIWKQEERQRIRKMVEHKTTYRLVFWIPKSKSYGKDVTINKMRTPPYFIMIKRSRI